MDPQPVNAAARAARRRHRYPRDAVCTRCLEADATAYLFQRHHPAGKANDPDLTAPPLCLNCHAKETANLQDRGIPMDLPPTLVHRIAAALAGIGSFLMLLGEALVGYAQILRGLIEALDVHLPTWQSLPAVAP